MRTTPLRLLLVWLSVSVSAKASAADLKVLVSATPPSAARIDPKLFGNFIELLEDVVPGTWAEMLNDRSFEGVTRPANWCYFDGAPTICDRQWDRTGTWDEDTNNAFNGQSSARLTATSPRAASLTQSGLSVTQGLSYHFSGYLRTGEPALKATVIL